MRTPQNMTETFRENIMNEISMASLFGGMFPEITDRMAGRPGFAVELQGLPAMEQRMELLSRTEAAGAG